MRIDPDKQLSLQDLAVWLDNPRRASLSPSAKTKIRACRKFLDRSIAEGGVFYGINTGFGALHDVRISSDDLEQLQYNLVVSHACGTGAEVPAGIVRLMLLLKIQSLSYGHSGTALKTVERLTAMMNADMLPVVYEVGSLGASGDLAPLAHLCLPLLGLGEVDLQGRRMSGKVALKKMGWEPIRLGSKEGLALLNGTQFMSAYGAALVIQARRLVELSDLVASLSFDAFGCRADALDADLHRIRRQPGQQLTAAALRNNLKGSQLLKEPKAQVQDPYSFRCIPQVHGASRDVFEHVATVFEREINSVTDNPNLFEAQNKIISGGNFHGQALALALDYLSLALAELGSISERRTYFLLSGYRGLPSFLIDRPGLNSGLMIPQYTAAALVSQNKQLATPASVDSIDSSNRQEDHVSMGANAATKCYRIFENLERILAIEWFTAAQAIDFRRPLKSSRLLEKQLADYRKQVPFVDKDRPLYKDMEKTREFLSTLG